MGDAGAHFLGLLMAASTMVISGRVPPDVPISGVTYFFFAPLFIPLFILGVPLVDMAFAFIRRTARGRKFDTPDKEHIHHRLLRLGHGPRRSVIILWAWTAILSGFLLFPLFVHRVNAIIPLGAAALGAALYTFFHPGLRRGNGEDEDERLDDPDQESSPLERAGGAGQRGGEVPLVIVWTPSGPGCDDDACVPRPPRLVRCCPRGMSDAGLRRATHRIGGEQSHAWSGERRPARPVVVSARAAAPECPVTRPSAEGRRSLGDFFFIGTACAVSVVRWRARSGTCWTRGWDTTPWLTFAGLAFGITSAVLLALLELPQVRLTADPDVRDTRGS